MFVSLYDLGGSQADANLFPDVDSTWKVYYNAPLYIFLLYL